jgi:LPXTG-site transpeptidase (sortase) family protein
MNPIHSLRRVFVVALITSAIVALMPASGLAEPMVNLRTARNFGVLAGSTITNTGSTVVTGTAGGSIAVSPGLAVTGFPPGLVFGGEILKGGAVAEQAQTDLTAAYNDAANRLTDVDLTDTNLGGLILASGVYDYTSSAQLTGNLTFDGQGDPDAVFIIKINSTLTTASNSTVSFINGAQPCHVFWVVGSSATLGTDSDFAGHLMALQSITANTGVDVVGQLLARNAAVTLQTNTITNDFCTLVAPEVTVVKTLAAGQASTVRVGDEVSYRIRVTNTGASTLTTVPLSDTFDSGHLAFVSALPSPDSSGAGQRSWNDLLGAGVLAPDESVDVTATFRATAAGASIPNTATVTGAKDTRGYIAHESSSTTYVAAEFEAGSLVVTKTADPPDGTVVTPGQTIHYTIGYANKSEVTVGSVTLVDALSAAVSYVPGTLVLNGTPISDTGNYDSGSRTVAVGLDSVEPGDSGSLTFEVTVAPWILSRAGIVNTGALAAGETIVATSAPVYHFVDSLDIVKSVSNTSGTVVRTGSVLQWTIVVTNRGIAPATSVVVTDTVPTNTTYVAGSITGTGADASAAPVLRWDVGTIPVGQSVTVTFKSSVNSATRNNTTISNQAFVGSDQSVQTASTLVTTVVYDRPTAVVRTSGAEDITLGLTALFGSLALGFAWHGRTGGTPRRRSLSRASAALLMSAVLVMGGMEAGASVGLPMPSPGEAIAGVAQPPVAETPVSSSAARVTIPRVGISQRVVEGRTKSALERGLWRQPTSATPGSPGASVIAGHRIARQFRKLPKVRKGDTVLVAYGGKKYKYRVAKVSTLKVKKTAPSFRVGSKEKLILYTCTPMWDGNKRTVVVCDPVAR